MDHVQEKPRITEAPPKAMPIGKPTADQCLDAICNAFPDFAASLDLEEVLVRVSEQIKSLTDYDCLAVLLLDELGSELSFRYGDGFPEEVTRNWRFGLGQGLVGTVAQKREPIVVGHARRDPRLAGCGADMESEMAVPLVVDGRLVGVLAVGKRTPEAYQQSDLRPIKALSGSLAVAIENARLFESVRGQAQTLSVLHEASRSLSSTLEIEPLLAKVGKLVRRIVNYDLFTVKFWDENAQVLREVYSVQFDKEVVPHGTLSMGQGICGTAAALRRSIRVPNVHLDARYVACDNGEIIGSELVTPLVFKDRMLGVLDLESRGYNAFSEHHEQMLATLAGSVAIAIENARLYGKVKEDEARLEQDLTTARKTQRRLFPATAPVIPGLEIAFAWEPAKILGGDFYDFVRYGDHQTGFVIGDVSGKATPAALLASMAVGVIRAKAMESCCNPDSMLESLNEPLRNTELDNRFVAIAMAVYNSQTQELSLANAAFPRPWLVRKGVAHQIDVTGLPLGILPDASYEVQRIQLAAGDLVVFCSDGVDESFDERGDQYGFERLKSVLEGAAGRPARAVVESILEDVKRHSQLRRQDQDDQTLVVLRVTKPS